MIRLLVFDAGRTLGRFSGLRTHDWIARLSPLPMEVVREECRRFLHTNPMPCATALADFCGAVLVDPAQLPPHWMTGQVPNLPPGHEHASAFEPYLYAADAVADMIAVTGAAAVVLSNLPSTTGPSQMASLAAQFPMIQRCYTSYGMRLRKPDPRLWLRIGEDWGVQPCEMVHFGDLWHVDVQGAARAGCRVVFLAGTTPGNEPGGGLAPDEAARVFVTDDLRDARVLVRRMRSTEDRGAVDRMP